MLRDKHDIEIRCDSTDSTDSTAHTVNVEVVQDEASPHTKRATATVNITIVNKSKKRPVTFRSCGFLMKNQNPAFTLHDERNVSQGLHRVIIHCGQSYTVRCSFRPKQVGVHCDNVAFTFANTDASGHEKVFHIVRYVKGRCTTTVANEIRSKEQYRPIRIRRPTAMGSVEPGEAPEG